MSSPGWSTVRQNRHRLGAIDGTWFLLSKSRSNRAGPCPGTSNRGPCSFSTSLLICLI
ncbi:hypothetical protein CFOL_v3_09191 [Cephalotus follicularis]|uniref:Uncharacterized protein n=1 Tax=Cephalotus follicularis TaxID=3775 RepID=A0A1Q3BCA8_CEPFO|nr:hypothetical protein CFOL_v3_09191 [Cephalotus follicularis]